MDMITYALCCKKINSIDKGAKIVVVQQLPTKGEANTIYLIPKDDSGDNDTFDEYIYVDSEWEKIGSTAIDLTDYVQKTDYATNQNAGVIKTNANFGTAMNNSGSLKGVSKTYEEYPNVHPDAFITRLTLDNYVDGRGLLDSSNVASVAMSGEYSDLSDIPTEYVYLYENINISSLSIYSSCNLILFNNIDSSITISIDGIHDFSINPGTAIMVLRSRYDTALYDDIYYIFLENKILKIKCYNNNGQFDILNVEEIKSYDVLEKNNTTAYTPSGDYNPATKKYVDDKGLFIATYNSTTYADIDNAVNANKIVYCKVGDRFAVLSYKSSSYYEFQYYRTVEKHVSGTNPNKDSVFIYKIAKSGNVWTTTERNTMAVYSAGNGIVFTDNLNNDTRAVSIDSTKVLLTNNTTAYVPDGDYNPATKKYVDDAISNAVTTVLGGSY